MPIPVSASDILLNTKTKGQILKTDLGLDRLQYVYIAKVINVSLNVYIIFFDSRFPNTHIPVYKIKNLDTFVMGKLKISSMGYGIDTFRITPPILLDEFTGKIPLNSLVYRLDICGERFSNTNLYESVNREKFKEQEIRVISL